MKNKCKCGTVCGDNRFSIIEAAKRHILDVTNIDSSPEEMKELDSFLFRCWQMGWLEQFDTFESTGPINEIHSWKCMSDHRYIYQLTENHYYEIIVEHRDAKDSIILNQVGSLYLVDEKGDNFNRELRMLHQPLSLLLVKAISEKY